MTFYTSFPPNLYTIIHTSINNVHIEHYSHIMKDKSGKYFTTNHPELRGFTTIYLPCVCSLSDPVQPTVRSIRLSFLARKIK